MKYTNLIHPVPQVDAIADVGDQIDIRIQDRGQGLGQVLYVDVNGVTVLRVGRIMQEVELVREGKITDLHPQSKWGVICKSCGQQGLTTYQYELQMMRPDKLWQCPRCMEVAVWDDDRFETACTAAYNNARIKQP